MEEELKESEYEVLKVINDTVSLALNGSSVCVLKRICGDDEDIYNKLIKVHNNNVAEIYDVIEKNGAKYVVEEYIDGVTLEGYLERKGALDVKETANIILAVCNGLQAVHMLGVVHRDINPKNIMISKSGIVKIIDFGISRTTKFGKSSDTFILGTQGYAAPEQFGFHQTNRKADIYALGVMMNYMLTLEFPNTKLATGALKPIIKKCIEIDENNRYGDVYELACAVSGKVKINKRVKTLPGFRRKIWWHGLLAGGFYFALIVLFAFTVLSFRNDLLNLFQCLWFEFNLTLAPFLFFTNYRGIKEKFGYSPKMGKGIKITYHILACILFIIISVLPIIVMPKK